MATQESIQAAVTTLAGSALDERGVGSVSEYVALALEDVSIYAPRVIHHVLTGDAGDEYDFPATWVQGFSVLRRAVYRSDADFDEPGSELLPEQYIIEQKADGTDQLRLLTLSPSSADRVVLTFTGRHTVTTLSAQQAQAVAQRSAALVCRAAATGTSGTVPQGHDADMVGFTGTQGDAYRRLADDFDREFDRLLGIDRTQAPRQTGPAVIVTVRAQPNRRNRRYLTHPHREAF